MVKNVKSSGRQFIVFSRTIDVLETKKNEKGIEVFETEYRYFKQCISKWMMKRLRALSGKRRCCSIITIYTDDITAEGFIAQLDKLMLESGEEYQRVNLNACSDYYVLNPKDLSYSGQSVGMARLKDGTFVGGVRHQF